MMENYLDLINFVKANKKYIYFCNISYDDTYITFFIDFNEILYHPNYSWKTDTITLFRSIVKQKTMFSFLIDDIQYNCSSDTKSLYLEISFDRKNFRKTIDIFDIDINSTGIFKTITYLNDKINSKLKECAKQKADLDQLIDDLNICMEFV